MEQPVEENDINVPEIQIVPPWDYETSSPCDAKYSEVRTVTSDAIAAVDTTWSLAADNVKLKKGELLFLQGSVFDNVLTTIDSMELGGEKVVLGQDSTTGSVPVDPYLYAADGAIGFRVPADSKGINMTGTCVAGTKAGTLFLVAVQHQARGRYWASKGS